MYEDNSMKSPLITRIRGIFHRRHRDFLLDELDDSHRSSRHAVSLDELSKDFVNLDDSSNRSKRTIPTTEEASLDFSERRSYENSGSSEAIAARPIEEETEVSEDEDEEQAEDEKDVGHLPTEERIKAKEPLLANTACSNSGPHRVRFSTVQVREYPICMGDNPGSSRGIPITIGWEILDETCYNVDVHQYRPRTLELNRFRLAPLDRVLLLKRMGYSGDEIREGTDRVDRHRAQRRRTTKQLHFSGIHELFEGLQRSILNSAVHRSKKMNEREYLSQYKSELSTPFEAASYTFRAPRKLRDSIVISGGTNVYLD